AGCPSRHDPPRLRVCVSLAFVSGRPRRFVRPAPGVVVPHASRPRSAANLRYAAAERAAGVAPVPTCLADPGPRLALKVSAELPRGPSQVVDAPGDRMRQHA